MQIEVIEIANRDGKRAMGILLEDAKTHFKLGYQGTSTEYPKPEWFKVEAKQYSKRFLVYSNSNKF